MTSSFAWRSSLTLRRPSNTVNDDESPVLSDWADDDPTLLVPARPTLRALLVLSASDGRKAFFAWLTPLLARGDGVLRLLHEDALPERDADRVLQADLRAGRGGLCAGHHGRRDQRGDEEHAAPSRC